MFNLITITALLIVPYTLAHLATHNAQLASNDEFSISTKAATNDYSNNSPINTQVNSLNLK